MSQFVMRNPYTAAAALFAPLFAQNEDRGYFRTALITTPIVFAAGQFIPKTFGSARDVAKTAVETRNLLQNAENWTRFDQRNPHDLSQLFKNKYTPSNVVDQATSAYLVSGKRASRDFLREEKVLNSLFQRKFVITNDLIQQSKDLSQPKAALAAQRRIAEIERMQSEKGYMLSKAMRSAEESGFTTAEWAERTKASWDTPSMAPLTNEEMIAMYQKYTNPIRPEFVKSLKNRLREVMNTSYKGTIETAVGPVGTRGVESYLGFDDFSAAERAFQAQAPETYELLEKAKGVNNSLTVSILSEDVVKGKVGRVLSYTIKRKERDGNIKELVVPVLDPKTGSVSLPNGATGVGDFVLDAEMREHRLDAWIARQLVENPTAPLHPIFAGEPSLQEEVNAHAYWHAGDPMDARRMAELEAFGGSAGQFSARARKLRSNAAKYSKLAVFLDEEGNKSTYRNLGASAQQNYVRKTFNSGLYLPLGSDAGVYEGRFVRRDVEWLSPYGAPSADKQESIWRAATKEFELRNVGDAYPTPFKSTAWSELGGADLPAAGIKVGSIDPQVRTALMEELHAKGQHDLAESFGRMGETGAVMQKGYADNFVVEGVSKYNMTERGVEIGDTVNPDAVMGYRNNERVMPRHAGTVIGVDRDAEGFVINVKHELDMAGAKFDIGGIKGMVAQVASNEHFEQMRAAANEYSQRAGLGDIIPDTVNALMPAEYFANKVEPAHAQLGIASDLVGRLVNAGQGDVVEPFLLRMKNELGTTFQHGQLVIDKAAVQADKTMDAAARLRKLTEISEQFFRDAGDAIRSAGGYQDPVLTAYVNSGKELGDWMLHNQLPGMMMLWDHSSVNAPRFSSITQDIFSHMYRSQNLSGLKALQNRVVTSSGGDARQSLDFMKHVMGGKFDTALGNVVPLSAARGQGDLNTAAGRMGSVFDPSLAQYKDNFSLDLGNGQYLPVPGTGAYMAEGKMFDPGKYQTHRWQNTIQDLAKETNAERAAELRTTVINQYKETFGIGKGNVLRPYLQDPMSVAGVFSVAEEGADPFTVRISEAAAKKVRSKRLRDALMRGEDVYGMPFRQPINQSMYTRVRLDKGLAGMDMAASERFLRAVIGDQDKDTAYLSLFDANIRTEEGKAFIADQANAIEGAAAMEAHEALTGGRQMEYLKSWEGVKGVAEVARFNTDFEMSALSKRAEKFAARVGNRKGIAINRMAGAAIGPYSNVLTEIEAHMEKNPAFLRDQGLSARMNALMFDIRQAPISARKASSFSLEEAQMHLGRFKNALQESNPEAAAHKLQGVLSSIGQILDPEYKTSKTAEYLNGQAMDDLLTFTRGRTNDATLMKEAFTSAMDRSKSIAGQKADKTLQRAFSDVEGLLGPAHGGMSAATANASKMGAVSEGLAEIGRAKANRVTGAVSKIMAKHGKAMALGFGALAALGIALTPNRAPVATFSRSSGNQFRPEERMGVTDHVPGEPVPGQMAPSNPPRRIVAAQPGVRKAMVASMGQTSDLSVKMRAEDSSRAAETARQMAQIPGSGDTNVTVNYRDRTKLRSLRTREKIRELR